MSTPRQIEANRLNALKSTGPCTPAGKAIVAQNATRHGVFCHKLLAEGDDPAELEQHIEGLMHDLAPRNFTERLLVGRIISASWRLRRLEAAETHLHETLADDERDSLAENGRYPGEEADREACEKIKSEKRQDKELERIDQRRRRWADEQPCTGGQTLALDLQQQQGSIERFSRYEKRLEGTIHRALRELRLLREERSENPEPTSLSPGGEGGGEGSSDVRAPREVRTSHAPLPNPLPGVPGRGNEELDPTSIAIVQNKPNLPSNQDPPEVYAESRAETVTPVCRPTVSDTPVGDLDG